MTPFAIVTVIHDSERDLSRLLDTIDRYLSPRPPGGDRGQRVVR